MKNLYIIIFTLSASFANALDFNNADSKSNPNIVALSTLSATSDGYNDLTASIGSTIVLGEEVRGFVLNNTFGVVQLSIPQSNSNVLVGAASVELTVTYQFIENGELITNSEDITLEVNVNSAEFKDIDYVKIDKAVKVDVAVDAVNGLAQFPDIELEVSCRGEYYDLISPQGTITNLHYTAPAQRGDGGYVDGNLLVSWDEQLIQNGSAIQPEYYELEWTYTSDPNGDGSTYIRDYLFRNNSSRVVVSNKSYFIPLVYEKGIIAFRVRAVGKNIANGQLTDVKTQWTTTENQTNISDLDPNHKYEFSGLETNMNWQSTITFAEEGKNKAVVTYHDGSLRNRQAVTRINTDERAVIGETYYDYNGRPVIQILPVPVEGLDENNFDYRPGFNVIDPAKNRLEKAEYDFGDPGQSCVPYAPEFSNTIGASNYYSSQNGFGSNGNVGQSILNKDLIPNAENYPYTQTMYRNDNTGRISAQSGVGKAHILGSSHETKYFYGAPNQAEISRLFGNQVGQSGHYKKNMVIDPNGQVSVSYMNPEGKVVATALAGDNNTNLETISGDNARILSPELLSTSTNELDSDGKGKTMIHKFPVTTSSAYTFDYSITAQTHTVTCTNLTDQQTIDLKMRGVFNVDLDLYDNCQSNIFSHSFITASDFGPGATGATETFSHTVPPELMNIGEYTLVKSLRINETKLNEYLTEYLSNDNYTCVLKDENFIADALNNIDVTACNLTCSECKTRIDGLIADVENKGIAVTANEKATLYDRCDELCLDNITCKASLFGMLAHLAPDGQYAGVHRKNAALSSMSTSLDSEDPNENLDPSNIDVQFQSTEDGEPTLDNDNAVVPESFRLSIFNNNNGLVPNHFLRSQNQAFARATWRRPIQVSKSSYTDPNYMNQIIFDQDISGATYTETNYYDINGNIVYASITPDGNGGFVPAVVSGAPVEDLSSEGTVGLYRVPIKYLSDVKVFLNYWQAHFVNYLVPYHPEYSYYVECTGRKTINSYVETLIDINDPIDDVNGDYTTTVVDNGVTYYIPDVLNQDPIFTDPNISQSYRDALIDKYNNFLRKTDGTDYINEYYTMAEAATIMVNCPNPHATCKNPDCESGRFEVGDIEEWTSFKSLYLGERERILKEISSINAIQGLYYNGCIGNADYFSSPERDLMLENSIVQVITYPQLSGSFSWFCRNFWCNGWNEPRIQYIQSINPHQTCADYRAPLFKDAFRSFYPSIPGDRSGVLIDNDCYEILLDENGDAGYVETECNAPILDQRAIMGEAAAARDYESCGNCPLVTQTQSFLGALIELDKLDESAIDFNCLTSTPNFSIGTELNSFIGSDPSELLSWSGTYDETTQMLSGTLSGHISTNSISFGIDFSGAGIPNLSNATNAAEIIDRLQVAGISVDPVVPNRAHLAVYIELSRLFPNDYDLMNPILASATGYNPGVSVQQLKFSIPVTMNQVTANGTVAIDLQTCDFEPICNTSNYGGKVLNFLNDLVYEDDTDIGNGEVVKPYDLDATQDVALTEFSMYEMSTRRLLGIDDFDGNDELLSGQLDGLNAVWKSDLVTSSSFSGSLSYNDGTAREVEINITPVSFSGITNTVDFTSVQKFANVRPFDINCSSGTCLSNMFYADAINLEDIDGKTGASVYHKVVIQVITSSGGNIDAGQPEITKCNKITTP